MRRPLFLVVPVLIFGCGENADAPSFKNLGPVANTATCSSEGGSCQMVGTPGIAVITSIETPDPTSNNCKDAVKVYFDFIPDDPKATEYYRFKTWPDEARHITMGDGKNPPLKWVEDKGISVGNLYSCCRLELTKGTCTPVVFDIEGIDFSDWADYCF